MKREYSQRMKKWFAAIAAVVAVAGGAGCSNDSDAPDPFTIKADMSMIFSGYGVLTMEPEHCDTVTTENGRWQSDVPVIFKQGDREIGTGSVISDLADIDQSTGYRVCSYTVSGTVTPKDNSSITAEFSDGGEWSQSIHDWQAGESAFIYQSSLDASDATDAGF